MPGIDIIINHKVKQRKWLALDNLELAAGLIEYEFLESAEHLVVGSLTEETLGDVSSNQALIIWLSWLEYLLTDSWLIKDNAMTCDAAYCRMETTDGHQEWSSNSLASSCSLSSGEQYKPVSFNRTDLKDWNKNSYQLRSYLHEKSSNITRDFIGKGFSRLGRALKFVHTAKLEAHPALKVVHYCSALESLFGTDTSELSHKLSERVAHFLGANDFSATTVFRDVKRLYGVRSKVAHGSHLKYDLNKLSEDSVSCDNYVRSIINLILQKPQFLTMLESSNEEINLYFEKLIFKSP